MFGEGKNDKDFIYALSGLDKFKNYYAKNWYFKFDNAHGCSASNVIKECKNQITGEEDLVLCFIDLDDLKNDYKQTWEEEKLKLEDDASKYDIKIIWFLDKLEEELRRVLGEEYNDHSANKEAKKSTEKFINSDLWNRIIELIKKRENELGVIKYKD